MANYILGGGINGAQFFGSGNTPLTGGKVYTYVPNTTTPLTTYKDEALTPHTNPIILDANGRPPMYAIWITDTTKIVVDDATDVLQYTIDDIPCSGGGLASVQIFTASDTYTPIAGLVTALVEVVGSGGAGGGAFISNTTECFVGGGGGAGGYAAEVLTATDIGASQTVTIGTAGAGAAAAVGGNGGACSFGGLISASGGIGGSAPAAGG